MAAARQNEMNERRTVVATTTRTRPSRVNGVRDTHAFRVTPAGLADGLGLGSVLRSLASPLPGLSGPTLVPPRPASGAGLRPSSDDTPKKSRKQPQRSRLSRRFLRA